MYFKECLRKVEFIFVGENLCRMSILLKEVKKKLNKNKSEIWLYNENKFDIICENFDIWMINFIDRYKGCFNVIIFEKMCFVEFCLEFVVFNEL